MSGDTELIGPIAGTKGADIVPPSLDQARQFARQSKSENTLRGYRADWRDFCAWCESHGLSLLPASTETVAAYIAECAGRLKVGSIQRRTNAIAEAHKATGLPPEAHDSTATRAASIARSRAGPRIATGGRGVARAALPGGLCGGGVSFPLLSSMPKGGRVSRGRLAGEAGLSAGRPAGS
jgi:hypothetical protein